MSFGILYESTLAKGPEMVVEAMPPVAAEYERVHFIGHAVWNPTITPDSMAERAKEIETGIEEKTGYRVFIVTISVTHYPPLMTDVDFVMDVPVESPIAPLLLVAIIVALAALLAFIVWLFWTTWVEKIRKYYCDQETPPTEFEGWLQYVAHLAEKHPKKYQAIQESKSKNWWEEIPSTIKWVVGGVVAVTVGGIVVALLRRRRE